MRRLGEGSRGTANRDLLGGDERAQEHAPRRTASGPEKFAVLAADFSEMWSILARMLGRRVEDWFPHRHVTTSTGDRERNTPALTKGERP